MIYNVQPRGHVWLQWGNWWWRIERPGDVIYRHWAGYLSAAEAGDACLVEMDRRRGLEAEARINVAGRLVANTHYAG